MFTSFRLFFTGIIKNVYFIFSLILCGLPSLLLPFINDLPFIKKYLPRVLQEHNITVVFVLIIIILIFMLVLSFVNYHKLRLKRINDVYEFTPEALKGKVFKDLYELYKTGEFLKNAGEERRKKWDEEVVIFLTNHFTNICKNNYLMATGRAFAPPRIIPINDSRYNDAVSAVKELLDNDFHTYFKV